MSSDYKYVDPLPNFIREGITNEADEVIHIGFSIRQDVRFQVNMYLKNSSMGFNLGPEV
jgi:hypothetical protein